MPDNLAYFFTATLTNQTLVIPDWVVEVFIKNIGAGSVTLTGNAGLTTPPVEIAPSTVSVVMGEAFSLGYVGRGRKGFSVAVPAGTTAYVSITL